MAETITPTVSGKVKQRRVFTNIHLTQIVHYRLPAAGWSSILHRVSGALLVALLPLTLWLFDQSVSSEASFERFRSVFEVGIGWLPGGLVKLMVLGLIWAYITHFLAGLRHLWVDVTHQLSKEQGRQSATLTLSSSAVLTLLCALKLFNVY